MIKLKHGLASHPPPRSRTAVIAVCQVPPRAKGQGQLLELGSKLTAARSMMRAGSNSRLRSQFWPRPITRATTRASSTKRGGACNDPHAILAAGCFSLGPICAPPAAARCRMAARSTAGVCKSNSSVCTNIYRNKSRIGKPQTRCLAFVSHFRKTNRKWNTHPRIKTREDPTPKDQINQQLQTRHVLKIDGLIGPYMQNEQVYQVKVPCKAAMPDCVVALYRCTKDKHFSTISAPLRK